VLLVAVPGTGVDGFAMAVGGGLSVVLLNLLYRMGVSGDEERVREEEARRYFDEHGVWPDDPRRKRGSGHCPRGSRRPRTPTNDDALARERPVRA
jgi:hypothetical protein